MQGHMRDILPTRLARSAATCDCSSACGVPCSSRHALQLCPVPGGYASHMPRDGLRIDVAPTAIIGTQIGGGIQCRCFTGIVQRLECGAVELPRRFTRVVSRRSPKAVDCHTRIGLNRHQEIIPGVRSAISWMLAMTKPSNKLSSSGFNPFRPVVTKDC